MKSSIQETQSKCSKTKFRTQYTEHNPSDYAFATLGDSMTQQQFKAECDVNNIMAKYRKTGLVTHLAKTQGNFGDFSTVEDYQTSLDKVMRAQESFDHLPSELRNKFQNDPAQLIAYLADEKNNEEAYKFALKIRPTQKENFQESMEKALENHDKKQKIKKPEAE